MVTPAQLAATTSATKSSIVINTYRSLAKIIRRMPEKQRPGAWSQLRDGYRQNIDETDPHSIDQLIEEAGKKIAFLRIVTPKETTNQSGVTRWVYKSGGKDADGKATARRTGHVVSNFNGSNMDPCNVKRHNQHLKRMGFVNNLHAKGLF